MAAEGLHISLSAEPIAHLGGFTFTNSTVTSLIVSCIIIAFAFAVRSQLSDTTRPRGLQNFAEWIVEALYGFVYSITGDFKKAALFLPLVATFFIFIIMNNWFGLLPGVGSIKVLEASENHQAVVESVTTTETALVTDAAVSNDHAVITSEHEDTTGTNHDAISLGDLDQALVMHETTGDESEVAVVDDHSNSVAEHGTETTHSGPVYVPLFRAGTADLNTTIALGLISIFMTQFFGFQFLHAGYLTKYFNFSSPIMFFVGILELISEFSKIISFAFRLFGNIFAGEVLLTVIMYLAGVIVPMPFYGLEIFVGFMQALVFSMLSVVFFNMATLGHGEHE